MPDLEEDLQALGAALDWPPTPALRIGRTIRLPRAQTPQIVPTDRRWALAAAAALLIVATLLAYAPSRNVIAGWLNLHTTIQRVQHPPSPSPLRPGQLGSNLDLGAPMTLAGAQGQVKWKIALPASLGMPEAVYVKLPPNGPSQGEVSLVYAERPGLKTSGVTGVAILVTEARGRVNEVFFQKMIGPDTPVEQVTVNGHPGYWISGHPHDFAFADANGDFYAESLRLATNTLVFDDNGTLVRIEGDMTKAQALQVAASIS